MRAALVVTLGSMMVGSASPGGAEEAPETIDRPDVRVLRLSDADLLGRFTPEVRSSARLGEQALALWRAHFEAQAREIEQRFLSEPDWRPALADAAALIDEFLEASELPREGFERASPGQVWVERLDPKTGRRIRELRPAPPVKTIFAPQNRGKEKPETPAVPAPLRAPRGR
jgi:hypothetical protein